MTPESSSDTPIRFRLFVAQADGLISYRLRFLARHRFYVTATDGAATRQTSVIRRSKDRSSVEWNESLGDFTVVPSSCLALRLCMKRRSSDFQVAGTLELQFDALRDSFVARDFDVVTVGEQRVTLRMAIEVSEPRLPVPNSGPASGSRTDHTPAKSDMALDLGSSLRVPLAADEALHRADEVTGRVKEPVHPLTAAMGHANNTLNILDRAGTMHDTWKKAVDKIRWVVDVTDKIAEVHPYAKMAWNIISLIPKALLAQVERDRNVQALLEAIHDAFDLISEEDLSRSMSAKQREILLAMLGHVHDCGGFIQTYAKNTGFRKRLLKNIGRGMDPQIEDYRTKLMLLRDQFLGHVAVTTGVTVTRISRELEGVAFQLEHVLDDISDLDLDGKIREIPYGEGSRFNPDKGCLEGTRADFLDSITNWVNDPESARTLVLFGEAGTGKSSIAHEVARRFSDMGRLCSSFMFVRRERFGRNAHLLLTTLVRDLADQYPSFKAALGKVIKNDTSLRLGATDYKTLFWSLLHRPLQDVDLVGPVLVIIDALDENGGATDDRGLHTFLAEHLSQLPPNFRFFITSRSERGFEPAFSAASSTEVKYVTDAILAAKTNDDILVFCLRQLPNHEAKARKLAEKAERSFQWAAVACDYVKNPPNGLTENDCFKDLLNPSTEEEAMEPLDSLYHTILKARFNLKDRRVRGRYQSVIGLLFATFEPLSISTLVSLRQHSQDRDGDDHVVAIIGSLGSLLSNVAAADQSLPIVPLHTSFRDFLTSEGKSGEFYIDLKKAHRQLAYCCLEAMIRNLRFNICRLPTSYERNDAIHDLGSRILKYIPASLLYGGRFWDSHLKLIDSDLDLLFNKLQSLLEDHYLPWLEFLSVTGNTRAAEPALLTVKEWLSGAVSLPERLSAFLALLDDALAFVQYFARPIARSAPHVYLSALPFTPSNSLIFSLYSGKFPNTISLKSGRLANWPIAESVSPAYNDNCLSVAYSPDGQRVASSSSNGMIHIWDAHTGKLVAGPFIGHTDSITSIAFSPDGLRIASGSVDHTIRVWNSKTGETEIGPLNGHTESVMSVSFSGDGQIMASGSFDNTIRVWDPRSGTLVAGPFRGHVRFVRSVACSPDGLHIASGSDDGTIRIWDTRTGDVVAGMLVGRSVTVSSVTFSSDGKRVASGSGDNSIHVWDVISGKLIAGPFRGHVNSVSSVVFSSDGKYIASGSNDKRVRVWDSRTGDMTAGPFCGNIAWVQSVSFSPDGRYIASGSKDGTIHLWKLAIGTTTNAPRKQARLPITSIAKSPGRDDVPSSSSLINSESDNVVTRGSIDFTDESRIDGNGWIRGPSMELLIWVPKAHRVGLARPSTVWMAGSENTTDSS